MVKAALQFLLVITAVNLAVVKPLWLSVNTGIASPPVLQSQTHPAVGSKYGYEPIQPIPQPGDFDTQMVALGERMFHDRRLHINGSRSCADCHDINQGGANTLRVSQNPSRGGMRHNTPTIFNVSLNKSYYWSARFTSLEHQLDDAINELGLTWNQLLEKLQREPAYVALFGSAFPASGITISNVKQAIIAYEQSLTTPNSRFDRYLRGDAQALSDEEKQGYHLFKSYGCSACHQGVNVGGNLAIDRAEIINAPHDIESHNIPEQQNGLSLGNRGIRKIRVPSLRNVALTAPYFHDGSVDTLEQAVTIMADTMVKSQLGVDVPHYEVKRIVAFLRTLTGEYNGKAL